MGIWSRILKATGTTDVQHRARAAGVVKDEPGWYYEESQNFSKSQSTLRIDQQRPGSWATLAPSCDIVGLNKTSRRDNVALFFNGSYRWLRLERERNVNLGVKAIKVIGTFRHTNGKEQAVDLGYLQQKLSEDLEGVDIRSLWGRIRFIRFPLPGRRTTYIIRFDLMQKCDVGGSG